MDDVCALATTTLAVHFGRPYDKQYVTSSVRRRYRHREDRCTRTAHERDHGAMGALVQSRILDRTLIVNQAHARAQRVRDLLQRAPGPPGAPRRGTPTPAPPTDHRTGPTRPPRHPQT